MEPKEYHEVPKEICITIFLQHHHKPFPKGYLRQKVQHDLKLKFVHNKQDFKKSLSFRRLHQRNLPDYWITEISLTNNHLLSYTLPTRRVLSTFESRISRFGYLHISVIFSKTSLEISLSKVSSFLHAAVITCIYSNNKLLQVTNAVNKHLRFFKSSYH